MNEEDRECFGDQDEDDSETLELTEEELEEAEEILEWAAVAAMLEAGLFP